jgi:colanic acid biosynthesis glycosyl transferase WcaI
MAAPAPRVVFLNRFYWPDLAATAQMLTDLAEDLAAQGWCVTVVTSDSAYDGGDLALPAHEQRNGVHIHRTHGTRFGRHGLAGRLLDYLSYVTGAFVRVLRLEPQDAVIGMSDPPFIVAIAMLAARLRGWKSVYWVQDLFPQVAAGLGVLRPGGATYRVADRIARWLNGHVDLTVALGPRMAERLIAAGSRPEKVTFVHNWADASSIHPVLPEANPFVAEHGLKGRFVVLYSGNAGRAHRFEGVMEAARQLRDDPGVIFLFIGGGKRTAELKREAAESGLGNVRFLAYLPREKLAASLSAASLSLVTEDSAMVGLLVPSKTYGILASGRPIAFMGSPDSDVSSLVRASDSGFVLDSSDGAGLRALIDRLRADPALSARLGANARRAAETLYDRQVATRNWARSVRQRLWPGGV